MIDGDNVAVGLRPHGERGLDGVAAAGVDGVGGPAAAGVCDLRPLELLALL